MRANNFFNYLAQNDPQSPAYSMLKEKYQPNPDSSLNEGANEIIGPFLADYIVGPIQYQLVAVAGVINNG